MTPRPWPSYIPAPRGTLTYPIPRDDTRALYRRYEALAEVLPDTTFVGRLARYQYLNMDQVVGQTLSAANNLLATLSPTETAARDTR